jgi:hypothetical protein
MENECREDSLQNAKHRLPDCFFICDLPIYRSGDQRSPFDLVVKPNQ